ncbi:MAG: hemolysin [Ilumatobacteraceae bacterium]|nr:hemolysin [Ilumatobacteraceae bacterium]MCU1388519.1 hemolysin [Ilumatobacteraceae bacterium]
MTLDTPHASPRTGSAQTTPDLHGVPAVLAKPMLRGWSHVLAFASLLALGGWLIADAAGTRRGPMLMIVYVAGTGAMFGVSSAYHRLRWKPAAKALMSKLDHCTIFLAIAGAYTPMAATCLTGWHRTSVLITAWGGAVIGITLEWVPFHLPRRVFAAIYVIVGWAIAPSILELFHGLGILGFMLVIGGGVAYTVGAVIYALKRPDPWPRVFGFHEVFHVCTIVGAGLHFAAMAAVVLPKF